MDALASDMQILISNKHKFVKRINEFIATCLCIFFN